MALGVSEAKPNAVVVAVAVSVLKVKPPYGAPVSHPILGERPAGAACRDACGFPARQDVASGKRGPQNGVRNGGSRAIRGCTFFWLLFFVQAKKSNPGAGRSTRKLIYYIDWPRAARTNS